MKKTDQHIRMGEQWMQGKPPVRLNIKHNTNHQIWKISHGTMELSGSRSQRAGNGGGALLAALLLTFWGLSGGQLGFSSVGYSLNFLLSFYHS